MSKSVALILYLGGSTILWLKGIIVIIYCPMQKVVASNIRDETLGHVPYIYNNQATYQGSTENRNTPCDYTYEACSKSVRPLAKKNTFTLREACNPNPLRSSLFVTERASSSGSAIVRSISGMPLCEWSRAWPPCSV